MENLAISVISVWRGGSTEGCSICAWGDLRIFALFASSIILGHEIAGVDVVALAVDGLEVGGLEVAEFETAVLGIVGPAVAVPVAA